MIWYRCSSLSLLSRLFLTGSLRPLQGLQLRLVSPSPLCSSTFRISNNIQIWIYPTSHQSRFVGKSFYSDGYAWIEKCVPVTKILDFGISFKGHLRRQAINLALLIWHCRRSRLGTGWPTYIGNQVRTSGELARGLVRSMLNFSLLWGLLITGRQILFFMLIDIRSGLLAGIGWFVYISKSQRIGLIFQDRFWFVHLPFVSITRLVQVDHISDQVIASLAFFL